MGGTQPPIFFTIRSYLSIPAKAETAEAFDLSTKPGPEGILSPGNSPAELLYKCRTTIGI
mgnify:CR=1 FL=1